MIAWGRPEGAAAAALRALVGAHIDRRQVEILREELRQEEARA